VPCRTAPCRERRESAMRLQGQRSNTGLKVALLVLAVLVVAAVVYLLYLAPG